ncbi:spore germination protein [Bacillus tropicus]|uniref:spore germination protein n=1 Tax=Bacillus tropicus TaxID=2026188 RepID=UPI002DB8A392|nr:spore germination protein [Bacillus tropicus]MEC3471207.1 spore germination protein [Bacillus tropicus]
MKEWIASIFEKKELKEKKKKLHEIFEMAKKSIDFKQFSPSDRLDFLYISYYRTLVEGEKLQRVLLSSIQRNLHSINTLEQLRSYIPLEDIIITKDTEEIESKLNQGFVIIQLKKTDELCALINVENASLGIRENNETENEFSVVGPKIGFVENIDVNIHLLRKQIVTSNLIFEEITIGTISKTKVVFFYLNDVTNPRHVKTVRERLEKIDFDVIFDSSQIDQIITDNSNTPFPLFLSTERIDRVIYALINGQVAIMSNGSPYAITGPATFMDFFMSPEDYYLPWIIGSFFRIIRIFGVVFSIFSTPIYVAILTYHYEIIPMDLLGPIVSSRANVPFPPVLEVIFLEITIELLREAGARLPTKIGQTLGIVGGIVIGQASVEAALTSTILLIIVSLSALASFTTPIFKMSNTIRLLRFPFILAASLWGGFGIILSIALLLTHLMRLKSLGTPYMVPLYPFRWSDYTDSFIRSSYKNTTNRLRYLKPKILERYNSANNHDDINNE